MLWTTELLDCALIGVCVVIRSNMAINRTASVKQLVHLQQHLKVA